MTKNIISASIFLLSLSSCSTTIDRTVPISKEFEASSQLITLETPTWRVSGTVYNMDIGSYSVTQSNTTWVSRDKELIDRTKDTNFINYILFDDVLSVITEEFEVEGTQRFSFSINDEDASVSTSKCEIFSHSLSKETISVDSNTSVIRTSPNMNFRQKTFLICTIEQNNSVWTLSLLSNKNESMKVSLSNNDETYDIKSISEIISIVDGVNGLEKRHSAPWRSLHSGLEFFYDNQQVAAFSFVGNPKIWLNESLSTDSKELMYAVNYSLAMFNWLDSDWR
ncbi:hypothetical protein [Shewanella donghaensis]|uniref:hypothetical protein n=1 Tax=Shewanella donghaensis TaxID=238836 RepID=UPI001181F592|nr:hypothetical protein [Shewanella donghaensis]